MIATMTWPAEYFKVDLEVPYTQSPSRLPDTLKQWKFLSILFILIKLGLWNQKKQTQDILNTHV